MRRVSGRFVVMAVVASASLAACSSDKVADTNTIAEASTEAPSIVDSTVVDSTPVVESTPIVDSTTVVDATPTFPATLGAPIISYTDPVDIAARSRPTPTSYLVERAGKIFELASDGTKGREVLDITDLTKAEGERGLLGLAFNPEGSGAYLNYTNLDGDTIIASMSIADDGSFNESSRQTIATIKQPYPNHNGGDILVDNADGSLYVFTGDGGSAGDPERHALDISSPLGKIWKLSLVGGKWNGGEPWAVGLRNPWRVSIDPVTNDLWIADVGQNQWEEINVVPFAEVQGKSFGWSALEGTHPYNADQQTVNATFPAVNPVYEYEHVDNNCSISGGVVYRGTNVPTTGTWYVFSDYCSGKIQALCLDEQRKSCGVVELGTVEQPVGVLTDANGEVWVLSQKGSIVPIVPVA